MRRAALSGILVSLLLSGGSGVVALTASPRSAEAAVVERVVAVVGERAIMLSDLRSRAAPFLVQVHGSVPVGAQRNAAISQVYKAVLQKIIDEELEERAASQAKVVVSAREIDEAIQRVAAQNRLTTEKLLAEAARSGIDEQQYRDELRRQLLQAKLINLRLQGRIRVTETDVRATYRKLQLEERQRLNFQAAWIVLRGATDDTGKTRRALAEKIAIEARNGDFASIARQYSEDAATRGGGGIMRSMRPQDLPQTLARIAIGLEVGETSAAVRVGDEYVIMKIIARDATELPSYEDAQRELAERVYMEKMGQARRTWLDALRRQSHVDVRL
jgi:peptidyl-prolyl cis-trans isomerase SurA